MSQFYKHCREKIVNVLFRDLALWYVYTVASAAAICYVCQYAYNFTAADLNGRIEGMWGVGYTTFSCMITVHHL